MSSNENTQALQEIVAGPRYGRGPRADRILSAVTALFICGISVAVIWSLPGGRTYVWAAPLAMTFVGLHAYQLLSLSLHTGKLERAIGALARRLEDIETAAAKGPS